MWTIETFPILSLAKEGTFDELPHIHTDKSLFLFYWEEALLLSAVASDPFRNRVNASENGNLTVVEFKFKLTPND